MSLRRSLAALVLVASLAPASAFAQVSDADKATARDLTVEGLALLEKRDYAAAADRFRRADSLFHAPTIMLGLARAYAGLGKLLAAQEAYSRVTHEPVPANASAAFTNAIADAHRELAALAPRVPGVVIQVKGPAEPQVTLDGAPVPVAALGVKRPVDPGQHVVKVVAPGFAPAEATFTAAEGKVESVSIELKPGAGGPPVAPPPPIAAPKGGAPPAAPPLQEPDKPASGGTQKTIGFVSIGVGAAALAMGAVTGGLALSKRGALLTDCPDGHCPKGSEAAHQSQIDAYNTMGTVSTVGFIAGGVLAATGVVLVVTAPKAKRTGWVNPIVGIGYLGAEGKF